MHEIASSSRLLGIARLCLSGETSPDCSASGSLSCRLGTVLTWLDALALFLALILVVVAFLAWQAYRRNRDLLPPESSAKRPPRPRRDA